MRKKNSKHRLVSLVILNYNGRDDTLEFLQSLKKTTYPNYEIIVVDNASTDGSVDAIRKKFPYVRIVRNKKNLGITRAENNGIKKSKGEYLIFLDNDMIAHDPNWISELVKTAESDEKIGSVVPMRISYYNPNIIQTAGGFRKSRLSKFIFKILGAPLPVTGVSLIKREIFNKIGLFDEKMFGDFGDTDIHYRIVKAGFKVVYEPKSKLLHKGGSTWEKKGYSRSSHHYKERLRFILKNYDPPLKPITLAINLIYYMFLIPYYAVMSRFDLSRAVRDGIVWNIKNWEDYI